MQHISAMRLIKHLRTYMHIAAIVYYPRYYSTYTASNLNSKPTYKCVQCKCVPQICQLFLSRTRTRGNGSSVYWCQDVNGHKTWRSFFFSLTSSAIVSAQINSFMLANVYACMCVRFYLYLCVCISCDVKLTGEKVHLNDITQIATVITLSMLRFARNKFICLRTDFYYATTQEW